MTAPNTPSFSQPLAGGEITSAHGTTHGGGDDILFKVRTSNQRGSADQAGTFRMLVSRTATEAGGNSQTAQNLWDSGWVGATTTTNMPLALRDAGVVEVATGPGQGQLGDSQGRVYVTGGIDAAGVVHSEVWSAPYTGGSIGSWRQERSMVVYPFAGSSSPNLSPRYAHGACFATFGQTGGAGSAGLGRGGVPWLICSGGFDGNNPNASAPLIAAPILSDGTLGPWITGGFSSYAYIQLVALPDPYLTSCIMASGGVPTATGTASPASFITLVRNAPASAKTMNDWDTPGGWWQPLPTSGGPSGIAGHCVSFDWANGILMLHRGTDNATTNQSGGYWITFGVDISGWTMSVGAGWTVISSTGTPAAANNARCLYFMAGQPGNWGGSPKSYVYIVGGTNLAAAAGCVSDRTAAISTVQIGTVTWSNATPSIPSIAWANSSNALTQARTGHGLVLGAHLGQGTGYPPWPDGGTNHLSVLGGAQASFVAMSTCSHSTLAYPVTGASNTAWNAGVGAGLATGDMGAGGSVTADTAADAPAGGQVAAMTFGAITSVSGSLADGDQLLATAWVTDRQGGDPSPPAYAAIQIGQPPTLSNVTPANASNPNNGRPALSFSYNAGLGGAPEDHWQIQVKQGATVVYDTGLRYDQQNSVPAMSIAPLLLPSTAYTLVIQAWSSAFDLTGTQISVTSTTTFTTTAFTVLGAPGSFTATPSAPNANVAFTWGAVGSATSYNLYYRRTGGSIWYLYANVGNVTSYTAMDHLALGVGYDFAVSTLSAVPAESALSSTQTATIPLGTGSSYLHVATQGTTYGLWLQVQGSPDMAAHIEAKSFLPFSQAAPVTRYGAADYHSLGLASTLLLDATPATLRSVQAIIDQVRFGGTAMYRDALGGMLTCSFDADQTVSVKPPYYRQLALKLTEVADTVGPYVKSGSAQGYLTLVNGSRPPLPTFTEERLI